MPAYVIHGDADDNVPISESYAPVDAAQPYTSPELHVEPGAGHWWDGDASPGVDCVDWPPLFELMEVTTFDPYALDFTYKTPSPSVNAVHLRHDHLLQHQLRVVQPAVH